MSESRREFREQGLGIFQLPLTNDNYTVVPKEDRFLVYSKVRNAYLSFDDMIDELDYPEYDEHYGYLIFIKKVPFKVAQLNENQFYDDLQDLLNYLGQLDDTFLSETLGFEYSIDESASFKRNRLIKLLESIAKDCTNDDLSQYTLSLNRTIFSMLLRIEYLLSTKTDHSIGGSTFGMEDFIKLMINAEIKHPLYQVIIINANVLAHKTITSQLRDDEPYSQEVLKSVVKDILRSYTKVSLVKTVSIEPFVKVTARAASKYYITTQRKISYTKHQIVEEE